MMRFHNEQKEFIISGVRFGGQPGKRRTVMIGSVCYPRHSIVEDRVSGICKQGSLKKLFDVMDVSASETGTPGAVMLYAETAQAMEAYLRAAADLTTFPLFLDSPSSEVRLAGCQIAGEMGIGDRVIYNSLSWSFKRRAIWGQGCRHQSSGPFGLQPQGYPDQGEDIPPRGRWRDPSRWTHRTRKTEWDQYASARHRSDGSRSECRSISEDYYCSKGQMGPTMRLRPAQRR